VEGDGDGDPCRWWAFVDEAIWVPPEGAGCYILAAAMVEYADLGAVRATLTGLLLPRQRRLHWREESIPRRRKIVAVVAQLEVIHVVVVGAPMDPPRQERARRKCMERLLYLLDAADVERVVVESRTALLNERDLTLVESLRGQRVLSDRLRVDTERPSGEPLLWVADVVAGAMRAAAAGTSADFADILASLIDRHDVTV
jgi:hypothetical protein